jgi:hypothetical protein
MFKRTKLISMVAIAALLGSGIATATRLIPLAQVRLYVVGAARGTGRRVCEGCLA